MNIPGVSRPIFREEFVLGETGPWLLESDESGSSTIIPERLLIEVNEPQLVQFATLTEPALGDFSLEVEGQIISGSPQSSYGVLFRMQSPQQFYRFEITGDGTYILERHDAGGTRALFMGDWRDATSINQGLNVVNRLGIEAEGPNISLLVNDVLLEQISDGVYSSGFIGLDAGTFDNAPLRVAFDNLVIRPPGAEQKVDIRREIERVTNLSVRSIKPLHGGDVGQVYLVQSENSPPLVAKVDRGPDPHLEIEAFMLDYLMENSKLPVPRTVYSSPELLIMSYLPGKSILSSTAQTHAAELLADLHALTAPAFGLGLPTLIGGLHQPNNWSASWISFFAEQRLIYMAEQGVIAGQLPPEIALRVEKFAGKLEKLLEEPSKPSLIHGDVWTTNVLAANERITAFLDPAIYYASPEIELAFITLFNTFGDPFFRRYQERRPLSPGFFTERRDIYNLYPLLVHVRLFGGSYVGSVHGILSRFGF